MVANNDDSTLGTYLDIGSLTLDGASSEQCTADIIAKAIMWNHGFAASDMVLRTHIKAKLVNEASPFTQGLADATESLDGQLLWTGSFLGRSVEWITSSTETSLPLYAR